MNQHEPREPGLLNWPAPAPAPGSAGADGEHTRARAHTRAAQVTRNFIQSLQHRDQQIIQVTALHPAALGAGGGPGEMDTNLNSCTQNADK